MPLEWASGDVESPQGTARLLLGSGEGQIWGRWGCEVSGWPQSKSFRGHGEEFGREHRKMGVRLDKRTNRRVRIGDCQLTGKPDKHGLLVIKTIWSMRGWVLRVSKSRAKTYGLSGGGNVYSWVQPSCWPSGACMWVLWVLDGFRPQKVSWQSYVPCWDRSYTQCAGSHNLAVRGTLIHSVIR